MLDNRFRDAFMSRSLLVLVAAAAPLLAGCNSAPVAAPRIWVRVDGKGIRDSSSLEAEFRAAGVQYLKIADAAGRGENSQPQTTVNVAAVVIQRRERDLEFITGLQQAERAGALPILTCWSQK